MEEDMAETTEMAEMIRIESLKLYKFPKVNNKVYNDMVDGQVLLIFRVFDDQYIGEPGQLSENFVGHPLEDITLLLESLCLSNLEDNEFLETVNEATSIANLFFHSQTNEELAFKLTRLIRSCYRFSDNALSVSSDYSLVFLVDVWRTYATKGFIEAKERILLLNTTSRQELSADNDEEEVEHVIVDDDYVDNGDESDDVCCEESSMSDEIMDNDDDLMSDVDDCDCRSLTMDDVYDDYTLEEEEEEEDEEVEDEKKEEITTEEIDNDIVIKRVRIWQAYKKETENDSETILEEIKPLITYEDLHWEIIGNDYVITKEAEKHGECAICLTPFAGKKIEHHPVFTWYHEETALTLVRLGCGHSFHPPCIFKWLEKNPTCPLCRSVSYVLV